MSKTKFYTQCTLTKENVTTVTHIPSDLAIVGQKVMLKDEDGTWDRGWTIKGAGEPIPAEIAEAKARAWCDIWKPSTNLTERGKK